MGGGGGVEWVEHSGAERSAVYWVFWNEVGWG